MRKDEPSVKMINNLGLFMKVKLPNSNVQSLKRKHDFVEIMKDWRFIEKKLTIKDISSLPEQSLTKKLSLLIPEHIKYKKQREEHLKNYRPPDYNFNNVPKSSHEFQNMSIKKESLQKISEDLATTQQTIKRRNGIRNLSTNLSEMKNFKRVEIKRFGSQEVKDDLNIVRMGNEFKKIINPKLIIEKNKIDVSLKLEEEETKKKLEIEEIKKKIELSKKLETKKVPTKHEKILKILPKLKDNLNNKYESYMKKLELSCDNINILENVSDYLIKIHNFRPPNKESLEIIKEAYLKELERLSKSRNMKRNQSATIVVNRNVNDFMEKDTEKTNFGRTKSSFFNKKILESDNQKKLTKEIEEWYNKINSLYKSEVYKSKIKESYLSNKHSAKLNLIPKNNFIHTLNKELNRTNSLLKFNHSRLNSYIQNKKFYYRNKMIFDNYKDDIISHDLKKDLLEEFEIKRKKHKFE